MIFDVIILSLLAFSAFIGYKKGLVGVLVSIIALAVSIILAIILQGTLSDYLYNDTTIGKTVETNIQNTLDEQVKNVDTKENKNNFINMFVNTDEITQNIEKGLSKKITKLVLKGISFAIIFVIVFIICYILSMILNIVFKLPILNSVNKIGGVGLNVIKALIKIWILLAVVSFVTIVPKFEFINETINSSILTKMLYNNNLILIILKSTLKI